MKRLGAFLLILSMVCCLCACGAAEQPQDTQPTQTQPVATEPEPTEPPTEPPAEQAREMIRNGDYQGALELLATVAEDEETAVLKLRAEMGDVAVGDQIALGHYEQDNDLENGGEEIVWVVLHTEENKALLLSLFCLETRPYHSANGAVTWAESPLRAWLNDEFCNAAFSAPEQCFLAETELETLDNWYYGTPGGENTLDRVFLLSMEEAQEYLSEELKLAQVSAYAKSTGCYDNALGRGWWWLRSPGIYSRDAAYISAIGEISKYGYVVNRSGWAVRPAIWIDLAV